jgi:hypothetical protein
LASVSGAAEGPKRKLRVIAYGDNEGILRRHGKDPASRDGGARNEIHQHFLEELKRLDSRERIDLILHTGDFIRFDPDPSLFIQEMGSLLPRFHPTTGGDEEFELGRYYRFVKKVPHLKEVIWKRIREDRNGFEYYYHVDKGGLHIISLFSPDNYSSSLHPEHRIYNFFRKENSHLPQSRWLLQALERIRSTDKESPIIVLSHRPVLNQSRYLTEIFDRFGVSIVLSGDAHVYAKAKFGRTLYLVTGIMGDVALGGCHVINDRSRREFQVPYKPCIPENRTLRSNPSEFMLDHYLDLTVLGKQIEVKAIALRDHQVMDSTVQSIGGL